MASQPQVVNRTNKVTSVLATGQLGYEWLPEFSDRARQVKLRAGHNQWFCAGLDGDTTGGIPDNTEELLSAFLREEESWDSNLYQSVPIRRMCSSAELSSLKPDGDGNVTRRCTSLLDERVEGDAELRVPNSCRRNFNDEPLNAYALYKALRKKVRLVGGCSWEAKDAKADSSFMVSLLFLFF